MPTNKVRVECGGGRGDGWFDWTRYGTYRERFRNRAAEGTESGVRGRRWRRAARAVHGAACPGVGGALPAATRRRPPARPPARRALHKPRYATPPLDSHLLVAPYFWHHTPFKIIICDSSFISAHSWTFIYLTLKKQCILKCLEQLFKLLNCLVKSSSDVSNRTFFK